MQGRGGQTGRRVLVTAVHQRQDRLSGEDLAEARSRPPNLPRVRQQQLLWATLRCGRLARRQRRERNHFRSCRLLIFVERWTFGDAVFGIGLMHGG
jgi:hypothetical protein